RVDRSGEKDDERHDAPLSFQQCVAVLAPAYHLKLKHEPLMKHSQRHPIRCDRRAMVITHREITVEPTLDPQPRPGTPALEPTFSHDLKVRAVKNSRTPLGPIAADHEPQAHAHVSHVR